MKCKYCGAPIPKGHSFCTKCGKKKQPVKIRLLGGILALLCLLAGCGFGLYYLLRPQAVNTALHDAGAFYADGRFLQYTGQFTDIPITDTASALQAAKDAIGYEDESALEPASVASLDGDTYYRFQQVCGGLPVFGRSVTVAADQRGTALAWTANTSEQTQALDYTPLTEDQIRTALLEYIETQLGLSGVTDLSFDEQALEQLVVYDLEGEPCVAHQVDAYFQADGNIQHELFLVDTARQAVCYACPQRNDLNSDVTIKRPGQSGTERSIDVTWAESGSNYYMMDNRRKIAGFEYQNGPFVPDDLGDVLVWGDRDFDPAMVDALYHVQYTYDYYQEKLGRISIDGTGRAWLGIITGYLTYKDKWDYLLNAFSDHGWSFNGTPGGLIAFSANPSKQYSAYLDIVAHEYSHLCAWYSTGLLGNRAPGAVNEAFADIMGLCVKASDTGQPSWIMADGTLHQRDLTKQVSYSDYQANGETHENSVILSHAAYLMWYGIDGDSEKAIQNMDLIAQLWYRAMLMFPSDCTFEQCRRCVESAAQMMGDRGILSSRQVGCVSEAFDAVGIQADPYLRYQIRPDAAFYVWNRENERYTDYQLQIGQGDHRVVLTDTDGVTPPSLEGRLAPGFYPALLINNQNPQQRMALILEVSNDTDAKDRLDLYTDFEQPDPIQPPPAYPDLNLSGTWAVDSAMTQGANEISFQEYWGNDTLETAPEMQLGEASLLGQGDFSYHIAGEIGGTGSYSVQGDEVVAVIRAYESGLHETLRLKIEPIEEVPYLVMEYQDPAKEKPYVIYWIQAGNGDSTAGDSSADPALYQRAVQGYLDYIQQKQGYDEAQRQYRLIYVNDDDIPELYVSGLSEAEGDQIITVDENGGLNTLQLNRTMGSSYIERGNLLCNDNGNMGTFTVDIYTIDQGQFVPIYDEPYLLHGQYEVRSIGIYGFDEDNTDFQTLDYFIWKGEPVSEEEFFEQYDAAFNRTEAQATHLNACGASEMIESLNALLQPAA